MPSSINRFQSLINQAGAKLSYKEVTTALKEFDRAGHSDAELDAARELLESGASMTDGAREALQNFVNRNALPDPFAQHRSALTAQIDAMTDADGTGGERVWASEMNKTIELLADYGATKDERWMAYGWLQSLDLTPGAAKVLKEFIFQPETPLPDLDEALLRKHLIKTLNNFHKSDTLPMNQRPWGNMWEPRPQVDLSAVPSARMELGEEVAEEGWSYAMVVTNRDDQPTLPSTNRRDYVWLERTNKETGEVQYLSDAPYSDFISKPSRYHESEALKPVRKEFGSLALGKERWDHVMSLAFPAEPERNERRSVDKVKKLDDGSYSVTLEREVPGADLRKIDPKLRMWADRAGHTIDTRDEVERVTLLLSPFGIPLVDAE